MPDEIAGDETGTELVRDEGGNTLTILVTPRGDGLPLDTLLRTIDEMLHILKELDRFLSGSPRTTIDWVVTSVTYNSPLMLRVIGRKKVDAPFPGRVVDAYLRTLSELESGVEPEGLSEASMTRALNLTRSIARDGIASMQFSAPNLPPVTPTARLAENVENIIKRRYYHEDAVIEGRLQTISVRGEPHFFIYDVLNDRKTRCTFREGLIFKAMKAIGKRVAVEGRVRYAREGWPLSVEVEDVRELREATDLPQFAEGEGIDITGGIESAEYVRRLRDAE
jgi:hypothetical protein